MARKSTTSSSAANSNGHPHPPASVEDSGLPQNIIPGTNRQDTKDEFDWDAPGYAAKARDLPFDPSLLPSGRRSLSSIGLQAFWLGFALALCSVSTAILSIEHKPIWRLFAFIGCLSIFHFLEFWTTARFNMPAARASSFLLRNGKEYAFAHSLATVEIITSTFFPKYQTFLVSSYSITIGITMVFAGQLLRSSAMAEAGTNFNHTPAKIKKEGHVLVTSGVYAWLRHPSYCAFFWWALGTQVMVGNKVCFLGYFFALWNFFKRRIRAEELTLVDFFGKDYEEYRKRTGTGIPFLR